MELLTEYADEAQVHVHCVASYRHILLSYPVQTVLQRMDGRASYPFSLQKLELEKAIQIISEFYVTYTAIVRQTFF
jgi:hypothetical protein